MVTFTSICPICRTPFANFANADGTSHKKTCSIECARISTGLTRRVARVESICPICGQAFEYRPRKRRKYCSRKCQYEGRRNTAKRVELVCGFCGKVFESPDPLNWATHVPPRFCSRICAGKGIAKEQGLHIRQETTFICEHCRRPFTRIARADRQYHFCNRQCYWAERRGENHHCWQGGNDRYYGPNWAAARLVALERDQYICQCCGISKEQLDVHHIISRKAFNGDWDSANAPGNLITLCSSCHARLHALEENHFR